MIRNPGSAWWRDQFNLSEHSDSYERLWWPLIREEFPEYESLWRGHIVATTNRIDSTMPRNDSWWSAFRNDPGIDNDLEQLVMHQYSIFYYFARASLAIKYQPIFFPRTASSFSISPSQISKTSCGEAAACGQTGVEERITVTRPLPEPTGADPDTSLSRGLRAQCAYRPWLACPRRSHTEMDPGSLRSFAPAREMGAIVAQGSDASCRRVRERQGACAASATRLRA